MIEVIQSLLRLQEIDSARHDAAEEVAAFAPAREADAAMSRYDALAAPTSPTVATPIDEQFRRGSSGPGDLMGAIGNGCGLPSLSVPSGFDADGLPTGIQFMARAYDENICLALGRAFQARRDWHTQHPSDLA